MSTNIYQATYPQNPQVDLIDNNGNIHFYIPTINRYVTYHNTHQFKDMLYGTKTFSPLKDKPQALEQLLARYKRKEQKRS
ncbi:hypothetical protein [Actinotignum urinale]|uniref:hypothetical protein n=1 Tax=Actinotignum urinale TaxID=190146 RepID=UPI0003B5E600|nr:hypothetical protein [Actinotignum urinale]MDY5159544.1 hypothetical protein [Actinotignum urinale]